jgi:hypothetical protein
LATPDVPVGVTLGTRLRGDQGRFAWNAALVAASGLDDLPNLEVRIDFDCHLGDHLSVTPSLLTFNAEDSNSVIPSPLNQTLKGWARAIVQHVTHTASAVVPVPLCQPPVRRLPPPNQ